MLDKLRFSFTLFAHLHNVAEGTILQVKKRGLRSHKIPTAFDQVSTNTLTVILQNIILVFVSLATLPTLGSSMALTNKHLFPTRLSHPAAPALPCQTWLKQQIQTSFVAQALLQSCNRK